MTSAPLNKRDAKKKKKESNGYKTHFLRNKMIIEPCQSNLKNMIIAGIY